MLCHITRHLDRRFWLYAALIAALSLWLRDGTPIWAITDAGHDDQLFLRHASSILKGDWLGHYDRLTHAKPPFYSIFIALAFLAQEITPEPRYRSRVIIALVMTCCECGQHMATGI